MPCKDIVYHKSGYSSITILEWVDAYIAVMKQSRQFDRRQFAFPLLLIIPIYQIGHQGGSLLG